MHKWPEAQEALDWYAKSREMTVFTEVPVTRPNWKGWAENCWERREVVAVPSADGGSVVPFDEETLGVAIARDLPVHPLIAWGYADRPAFGYLATRQAYLARSWRPQGPVQPVALVRPGGGHNNCTPAYSAAGFDVLAIPGEAPQKKNHGGGGPAGNDPFDAPGGGEDMLLHALWTERQRVGWWLAELPVGFPKDHPHDGHARRIDAVVVSWPEPRHNKASANLADFGAAVATGARIELIEAKKKLNASVLGQLLCGAHMFADSWPGHGELSLTACVMDAGDEAVQWFCARNGIRVEVVSPAAERPTAGAPPQAA